MSVSKATGGRGSQRGKRNKNAGDKSAELGGNVVKKRQRKIEGRKVVTAGLVGSVKRRIVWGRWAASPTGLQVL